MGVDTARHEVSTAVAISLEISKTDPAPRIRCGCCLVADALSRGSLGPRGFNYNDHYLSCQLEFSRTQKRSNL